MIALREEKKKMVKKKEKKRKLKKITENMGQSYDSLNTGRVRQYYIYIYPLFVRVS